MNQLLSEASPMAITATLFLVAFAALSAVDGLWLHLWRLRLHARPESRTEHGLHTVRSVLFVPILALVFAAPSPTALGVGLAIVALDQVVELADTWIEKASRRGIGGLGSFEYSLHVVLTTARTAALVLAAILPVHGGDRMLLAEVAGLLLPGAALVAVVHVGLAVPRPCCATA